MIISKPKGSALFSLTVFVLLCFGLFFLFLMNFMRAQSFSWINYILMLTVGSLGFALAFRMLLNYKIISAGKGKVIIRQKFIFRRYTFDLKELNDLQEEVSKSFNGVYKQLTFRFPGKTFVINNNEYSDYEKLISYFQSKQKGKKQQKSAR